MKHLTTIICLTLTLFLGSVENSKSADFQKGLTAALSGDFATALREWKPLAKQGNADAQYNLGYMYQKGLGVPQDDKTAVKWYTLAAKQGNALAQSNLGLMYQKGRGVPQDDKTAAKWYTLAAEQGNANARTNLSNLQKRMAKTRKTPTVTAKRTSPPSPSVGESSALPPCTGGNYSNCFGTHTFGNGNKYVGEWKNGKRNGQGIFTWANGNKYVGEWENGRLHGHGTFTYAKSGKKYVGEYKKNKQHGKGTYTWANGNKYVGEFRNDKRNGQGTYTFASGGKYVGEYKNNKQHGQGTQTFSAPHKSAGQKYVGGFKDNKRHGQGTFTWANGDKYVGEYKNNKQNGQGTYIWAEGHKYVGDWKGQLKHGQGTQTFANGNKYVGEYRDGKRSGQGTLTFANGKIKKGMFENGKFVGKGFAHAKSIDSIDSSKFKTGTEYTKYTDSSCKSGKNVVAYSGGRTNRVCVNKIDYEYLCNKAKSITTFARRKTSVTYRSAFSTFIGSGGNFGSLKINFRAPKYCAVSFVISGVFDGTSTRKLISGRGTTFIVTKSGEILIHNVSTF